MKADNELIAEFMGVPIDKRYGLEVEMPPDNPSAKGYWMRPKYDTSWDWLMPVVEKISNHVYADWEDNNGYKNVTIRERAYFRTFGMIDSEGRWMVRINAMELHQEDSLIKATYNAVVEFIKWYNANK